MEVEDADLCEFSEGVVVEFDFDAFYEWSDYIQLPTPLLPSRIKLHRLIRHNRLLRNLLRQILLIRYLRILIIPLYLLHHYSLIVESSEMSASG